MAPSCAKCSSSGLRLSASPARFGGVDRGTPSAREVIDLRARGRGRQARPPIDPRDGSGPSGPPPQFAWVTLALDGAVLMLDTKYDEGRGPPTPDPARVARAVAARIAPGS